MLPPVCIGMTENQEQRLPHGRVSRFLFLLYLNLMNNTTADLCDQYADQVQAAAVSSFRDYGGAAAFSGMVATVKCFEDNSCVRASLEEPGEGRVLLVDGGSSMRCALLGDKLARLACDNGWSGVIVNGCIRDSKILRTIAIGVKALASCPVKSEKKNLGEAGVKLHFAGLTFKPGQYIYADRDGVLLAEKALE